MLLLKTVSMILIAAGLIWLVSIIVAPLTLGPGTILLGEEGRANYIDYPHIWVRVPLFHKIVYGLGDLICHQKRSRSFIINGNQMPVCSRDTGLYLGVVATLIPLFITNIYYPLLYRKFVSNLFRSRVKFLFIYFIFSGPLIFDFFTQYFGLRNSDNIIRLVTGFLFGIINMILFYHLLLEEQ